MNVRSKADLAAGPSIDPLRARHLELVERVIDGPYGPTRVTIDECESPLAWLVRRKGRDGRSLIEPAQFLAGERLRGEFTRAQLMPRTTSNWATPVADGPRGGTVAEFSDSVIAARQRVRNALDAVGPEFSGLLLDVCCFLRSLADVERDRRWPARAAKVVLQLGLDRLARHYGLHDAVHGRATSNLRTWLAEDAEFVVRVGGDNASDNCSESGAGVAPDALDHGTKPV
jgi:hypothetical protein